MEIIVDNVTPITQKLSPIPEHQIDRNDEKVSRYQRLKEIKNINGFVVNIHDATNFDIDLDLPVELRDKYNDVISNEYFYQDLPSDFLENPNLANQQLIPCKSKTYRCRLKGIGINQLPNNYHIHKNNIISYEIKQLIDNNDGWVLCNLSDIDVYQRLLVDIIIPTNTENISLKDFLLNKMNYEDNPLFYPYSTYKRTFNGRKSASV